MNGALQVLSVSTLSVQQSFSQTEWKKVDHFLISINKGEVHVLRMKKKKYVLT